MWNRTSYPSVELPPATVRKLRAEGLSLTRIARQLRIKPANFRRRLQQDSELQSALAAGAADYEAEKARRPKRRAAAVASGGRRDDWDDAEFDTTVPLAPLDDIILNAIAAGTCDRPAIERLLNPHKSPHIQIVPSLERLLQHGKISELPPCGGILLTKYESAIIYE